MVSAERVVLPRPKAHWVKLRCAVWYYVRLSQVRKGTASRAVVPGITHATRAIVEGRINAMCYEGEEEDEDVETPASPRRTPGSTGKSPPPAFVPVRFGAEKHPPPQLRLTQHTSAKFMRLSMRDQSHSPGSQLSPISSAGLMEGEDAPGTPRRRKSAGSDGEDDLEQRVAEVNRPQTLRDEIFHTFNNPEYSERAKYVSFVILTLIVVSTMSFILDTRPEYEGSTALYVIEVVCIVVFTIEYLVKFVTARRRLEFFRQPMNLIDLAAIVPFYFELIILVASGGDGGNIPTGLLRLFRLFRVFRVLKLGARMKKLEVVAAAVGDSLDMFAMLVFLLLLALVLFSTLIYFCEKDKWVGLDALDAHAGDPFASIPRSFWWCMVTLMTVGYGDSVPLTIEGKLVASVTMVASVLIMALPISVIGANFTQRWMVYRDDTAAKAREETLVPTFAKFSHELESHNFVLDEVLHAVEEKEILIEQEVGALKGIFDEATGMSIDDGDVAARERRRNLLADFDERFERLQDTREELDEVLAYAELLSSGIFTALLETCLNKNQRMEGVMDATEVMLGDVDGLVRRVNELAAEKLELSPGGSEKPTYSRSNSGRSNGSQPSFSRSTSLSESNGTTPPFSRSNSGRRE